MCTRMHVGIVCALCMCVHMGACVHTEYSSAGAEKCRHRMRPTRLRSHEDTVCL